MKLAILEAGTPPPALEERFGRYPAMFESLLGLDARTYDVAGRRAAARRRPPRRLSDHRLVGRSL